MPPGSWAEAVADAAHRADQQRRRRVALELLAQVPDVHVDRPLLAVIGRIPDALEQRAAREHAAGRAHQRAQDLELHIGELYGLAIALGGAARGVQAHALGL